MRYNCVLLVDDDGVTNFIHHRLIKKLGVTSSIQSAVNGNEALKFLREFALKNSNHGPELILLDINMPVIDGFEFLEQFEKMNLDNQTKIKIIVLTTSTHQKDLVKIAQREGRLEYINKPLTEDKLRDVLNKNVSTGAANA